MSAPPVSLSLPDRAGLPQAGPLAADLAQALAGPGPVRLDTAPAQDVGLAVLQLLVAAHRQAAAAGVRLEIAVPAGSAMETAMKLHGLSDAGLVGADGLWTGLPVGVAQG
ncbi:STAS domain-containing protein [Cereibacter johrii]|uniref:STAS domain-containing protein n=1 Tax=Cereibacter johrii TaxID=445629 RepID=A0ABX5JIF5_9RHOB|nr:STAS domain-containing protein [Cereibacter johrii]ODM41555.1 hypothetical protein A9O63_16190 [Cereibacter johrii]PTM81814.1 STAS domain-containing protein [Cereibacter johrii]